MCLSQAGDRRLAAGYVLDRFQLLSIGVARRRDKEVGSFTAAHSDRVVLASLASPNTAERFAFYSAKAAMRGGVYLLVDDFVSLRWIAVVVPSDPFGDGDTVGFVQRRSGALNHHVVTIVVGAKKHLEFGEVGGVAVGAQAD